MNVEQEGNEDKEFSDDSCNKQDFEEENESNDANRLFIASSASR